MGHSSLILEVKKLTIDQNTEEGLLLLKIGGELDASTSIDLDGVINSALEDNKINILVNCKDLVYISSAGFGVFVSYIRDLAARNGKFVLYNLNKNVYDTFKILGLDDLLLIAKNEREAKSYFA